MSEINYAYGLTVGNAPEIRKLGVVHYNDISRNTYAEMTPFVRKGRLMRVETVWTPGGGAWFLIRDVETNQTCPPFAFDCYFSSAYCENDIVYVFGSTASKPGRCGGCGIKMFWSDDLEHWSEKLVIDQPGWTFYNTSVCKGRDGYVMAMEIGDPPEIAGVRFTIYFAVSHDLMNWNMMPLNCNYSKFRYTACPVLRYADDDYYYMIYLEALPLLRYAPYICRTRDFTDFEIGLHNPIMFCSPEDKQPKPGRYFPEETLQKIRTYLNINDCDIDLCEYCGYTYINYLTGDQHGVNCMCEAVYDGPMDDFLKGFFT
jgi:hypothetical protein